MYLKLLWFIYRILTPFNDAYNYLDCLIFTLESRKRIKKEYKTPNELYLEEQQKILSYWKSYWAEPGKIDRWREMHEAAQKKRKEDHAKIRERQNNLSNWDKGLVVNANKNEIISSEDWGVDKLMSTKQEMFVKFLKEKNLSIEGIEKDLSILNEEFLKQYNDRA